jgi:hypothetical protein
MKNGIYRYEQGENPYDTGTLVVEAKDTEKVLTLTVKERDMRYSTYVDVLFGKKTTISIRKGNSPHSLNMGEEWFVVYPNRMGVPLSFVLDERSRK